MLELPGWLLKRARDLGARTAHVILEPAKPHSQAIYLLDAPIGFELHIVDDAESGIDGTTIQLNRHEAAVMLGNLAGALGGRRAGHEVRPLPPLPIDVAPPAAEAKS